MSDEEREIISEIAIAEQSLKGDIEKNTREAEESLDEILTRGDMEFCSRCGRKVEGRTDWAGRCLAKGCEKLICRDCWIARKRRFCMEHYKQMVAKGPEEKAREKVFFKEDVPKPGEEAIKPDMGTLKEGREDERLRKETETLAKNYANFLEARFKADGVLDFSPEGFFEKPRMERKERDDETWLRIFTKGFLSSKDRLQVVVKPIHSENANYLVAKIQESLKGMKGYPVVVLVGEKSPSSTITYVRKFRGSLSLFLVEPGGSLLYFNEGIPINRLYSVWLRQDKNPLGFREVLHSLADNVSNRWVVSEKDVAGEFGYAEDKTRKILKDCRFLSAVPDTDQFLFKKE